MNESHCRYLDIFLGVLLILSMLNLLYGSYQESALFIIGFLAFSLPSPWPWS